MNAMFESTKISSSHLIADESRVASDIFVKDTCSDGDNSVGRCLPYQTWQWDFISRASNHGG